MATLAEFYNITGLSVGIDNLNLESALSKVLETTAGNTLFEAIKKVAGGNPEFSS